MKTTHKFDLVILCCFLQLIPVYCGSDELKYSWEKLNSSYTNDIKQTNQIYNAIKEEQRALAELRTYVERHLRIKNAVVLTNALNSQNFSTTATNLQEILNNLDSSYGVQLVDGIFSTAIDEIILTNPLPRVPQLLWTIYLQNNSRSYEIMLRAQIQLYNKFGQKEHTDEKEFLFLFANKLHKIQKEPLYRTVDLSVKLKIQKIIERLPYNLKYLYFMPYFCLENIEHSTYIYTAIEMKVDPLSRYIWLWRDSRTMDDTGYIKAEVSEYNTENDMKLYVALKGTKYQMYYYMMPNTMKIAGWEHIDFPINYIWEIEFLDSDRVVFSQNDYLMCAAESHDGDRRNVKGRKIGEVSTMSPECQWRLGKCIFR